MTEYHDEWYTIPDWYLKLCETYNVFPTLDVAAIESSHMCDRYFTKEDDALTKEWDEDFWMNPPLLGGLTKKFVLYAEQQAIKHNVSGLCVIPAGVIARQWFRHLWNRFKNNEIFLEPINRPSFSEKGLPVVAQARNDYIVLVFRKKE